MKILLIITAIILILIFSIDFITSGDWIAILIIDLICISGMFYPSTANETNLNP